MKKAAEASARSVAFFSFEAYNAEKTKGHEIDELYTDTD